MKTESHVPSAFVLLLCLLGLAFAAQQVVTTDSTTPERRVGVSVVTSSAGAGDAGKFFKLDSLGKVDASFLPQDITGYHHFTGTSNRFDGVVYFDTAVFNTITNTTQFVTSLQLAGDLDGNQKAITNLSRITYAPAAAVTSAPNGTNTISVVSNQFQTVTLTNSTRLVFSNPIAGRGVTVFCVGGTSTNNVILPAFYFKGGAITNAVPPNQIGVLSVMYRDTDDTNACAAWALFSK
jgi:hypothetical protein